MHIGHAFKEACTSGDMSGDWCTVVTRTIGKTSVLFGAQVDCIRGERNVTVSYPFLLKITDEDADYRQPANIVQLKTMAEKYRARDALGWLISPSITRLTYIIILGHIRRTGTSWEAGTCRRTLLVSLQYL